jgi:hypothetical protein
VIPARTLARALVPLLLHALAREVDRAVGVLLHTTLELPDFVGQALRLVDPAQALRGVVLWLLGGAGVATVLAWLVRRRETKAWPEALEAVAPAALPLLLRPALTLAALLSLAVSPTYPYGFTLPVALTQDWGVAQDAFALAAALALVARVPRLPAPAPGELFFASFLAYALMVPAWARSWDGHPGNEPKYLRMALAVGHRLSLDVDGIDAAMEELPVEPLAAALPRALVRLTNESLAMLRSLPGSFSAEAIRGSRVARQTIRGKDGGVYHVLAPGPSLLLAPLLRVDRELNRLSGTPGRLRVSLLFWNALAAALVAALFLLLRDATLRPGLSAALAGAFALLPPFLFYPFQFFPEMAGALVLALALRQLLLARRLSERSLAGLGLLLAALPWLHQKFLPVWGVLGAMALYSAVDRLATLRGLCWLVAPQAVSLWLTALLNFATTGSVRPDSLFLAWGPAGITTDHVGQGFFGLLLDQRYGILPYAPIYLAATAGLLAAGRGAARLRLFLPAALVYYMTVAMADDWHGAVSNLGRYFMPVAPYAIALLGVAVAAAGRGAVSLVLALLAISALVARALWLDPHAANEATRLLARSAIADGAVYVPDLFIKSFAEAAPGLLPRIGCWLVLGAALGVFLSRAAAGRGGGSPNRALAGAVALVMACGLLLERWPSSSRVARFPNALEVRPGTTAFASGAASVERGSLLAGNGATLLLVRSRAPLSQLALLAEGEGIIRMRGRPPLLVGPGGEWGALPLEPIVTLTGRRGVSETLYRQRIDVRASGPLLLRLQAGE